MSGLERRGWCVPDMSLKRVCQDGQQAVAARGMSPPEDEVFNRRTSRHYLRRPCGDEEPHTKYEFHPDRKWVSWLTSTSFLQLCVNTLLGGTIPASRP